MSISGTLMWIHPTAKPPVRSHSNWNLVNIHKSMPHLILELDESSARAEVHRNVHKSDTVNFLNVPDGIFINIKPHDLTMLLLGGLPPNFIRDVNKQMGIVI